MFKYLGVDMDSYLNDAGYTPKAEGGILYFVNSSYINEKLLQPWVDCAMVLQCIAPAGSQNTRPRWEGPGIPRAPLWPISYQRVNVQELERFVLQRQRCS